MYPFAVKALPQSLLCYLGRSVSHFVHPRNCLERAWKLSRNVKNFMQKVKFFNVVLILTTSIITPGHSPTLYDTVYTFLNCVSPFGALMVYRNRQSAKSREIIERAQLSRKWSTFPKPWPQSISGCRIFLGLSPTPSEPVHIKAHQGRF